MPLIMHHLEDILLDLLHSNSELSLVNMRWMTTSPSADDQDLVLHFVNNIASSYVASKMPGEPIKR